MAVYRIFPDYDAFINTQVITANAGYDEMLELAGYNLQDVGQTSRTLIHFKSSEITNVINNKIGDNTWSASLDLKLATAYEFPYTHSVYAYPVAQAWVGGVGKFADDITTGSADKSGVSWRYREPNETASWTIEAPYGTNITASFNSQYPGGGTWYTGSGGVNLESEQEFTTGQDLDIDINITNAVELHYSGTINNYGYILKLEDNLEFFTSASVIARYYSSNTNTIYPPALKFSWNDQSYNTGSLTVLTSSEAVVEVTNNRGKYQDSGKYRFRLLARPKNPVRTFTTGSIYKTNYALPSGSHYGLKDEFVDDMVIPFDTGSTLISCDSSGSFLDLYMDGLQPERHYRLLIKTEIDGSTFIDDSNVFKVVRHG